MSTVRELLDQWKVQEVFHISANVTVHEAACYMSERNIGAVAVLDGDQLLGILSERDILTKVVCRKQEANHVTVAEVMTTNLVVAESDETCEQAAQKMKAANCRHIPVLQKGRFLGMLSLRDLLRSDLDQKIEQVELLDSYVWNLPSRPRT